MRIGIVDTCRLQQILGNRSAAVKIAVGAILIVVLAAPSRSEDEDQVPPGILAKYRVGEHSATRIEPDVEFQWGTESPDPRLPPGPFSAHWSGQLLIREKEPLQFHAYLQGRVVVTIDGQPVLRGRRSAPEWISGAPLSLGFGERPIKINFSAASTGATMRLFWSSSRFPLEPVPAHLFVCDDSAAAEAARFASVEKGRREFEFRRCNSCHRRSERFALSSPSLTHVASRVTEREIIRRLVAKTRPEFERMPIFEFNPDEAVAIARFLVANADGKPPNRSKENRTGSDPKASTQTRLAKEGKNQVSSKRDVERGKDHVCSIGCLACHTIPGSKPNEFLGTAGPYSGGDLSSIGARRTPDWLNTWLTKPSDIDPAHRMPVFSFKKKERQQIVGYLASLRGFSDRSQNPSDGTTVTASSDSTTLSRGRELVLRARCAACHEIPGISVNVAGLSDLAQRTINWDRSCVAPQVDRHRMRPAFPGMDVVAVKAYLSECRKPLSSESMILRGERLLERKNCTACHARGSQPGFAPIAARLAKQHQFLRSHSEALIPPNLTAVGDKLLDRALAVSIRGGGKNRHRNWLTVRMPLFEHTKAEEQALMAALIRHDRIPGEAPDARQRSNSEAGRKTSDNQEEMLDAAQRLLGIQGFSCIACHDMGKYVPKNVAIPSHGTDLVALGKRMRREFFLRWTRSPLRVRPGVEMPSYERPVTGVLDGSTESQLAALWAALNDPHFEPPTNPSQVEQFLTVAAGQPARIVRDVFQNREGNGGPVARAFAIGLGNSHSALIDLDGGCLRDWRIGDFARQFTAGKSWFWDLAGTPLAARFSSHPEIVLRKRNSAAPPILPEPVSGAIERLQSYRNVGDGVEVSYRLVFDVDNGPRSLDIRESISPFQSGQTSGFRRRIELLNAIDGFQPAVSFNIPDGLTTGAEISFLGSVNRSAPAMTGSFVPFETSERDLHGSLTIEYRSKAKSEHSAIPVHMPSALKPEVVDCVPGFDGVRLPLDRAIMPTAIAWTSRGALVFTSLKGHVYRVKDSDGDGIGDQLGLIDEGLAAPYGLIADGHDLIVAHKPELVRLSNVDGDRPANIRRVLASGWGYTENYHDWTCGIVRDHSGFLYVGTGSDYAQKKRAPALSLWRGKVLRIDPSNGAVSAIAHALRYPTGLAFDEQGRLFVTDNQGHQNPFNELNHVVDGAHFGVPSLHDEEPNAPVAPPAIEIPHPWTRSVNGICFLPRTAALGPLGGQGIGCEYNGRFLVRFTIQEVDGTVQGAVYPLSRDQSPTTDKGAAARTSRGFMGPLCCAVSPSGDIFIGGIQDSGWLGGANIGEIVRLRPNGKLPNGLREIRATADGFELRFFSAVDRAQAERTDSYTISGFTRIWKGGYATPDSGQHRLRVRRRELSKDGRAVILHTQPLREGFVYEISCSNLNGDGALFWPTSGYYTVRRIPRARNIGATRP